MEDIPLLAGSFIRQLRSKSGKDIRGVSHEAMNLFMNYHWPGNVRELKSSLEYAFVIAEEGLIELEQLPAHIGMASSDVCRPQSLPEGGSEEKQDLLEALRAARGNQSQAARILGISRVTVWNRMRKHGIDLKKTVRGS